MKVLESLKIQKNLLNKFKQTDEEYLVATSKNIKYCPTADCENVINKPCCTNRVLCAACNKDSCFKCAKSWH